MNYKKSQFGWIMVGMFLPIILFVYLAFANQWGNIPLPFIALVALIVSFIVVSALFYKLTIEIDE